MWRGSRPASSIAARQASSASKPSGCCDWRTSSENPIPTIAVLPLPCHIAHLLSHRPELRDNNPGAAIFEPELGAAADPQPGKIGMRQIRNHQKQRLLLELDHDIDVRDLGLKSGDARLMHD